ncbi:MAG: enoyl-CoA hydratase/isomerase family protein [Gammaproteobacteria bacterium]|nr:enoyl-CoA hydratase/isomerase family protein [Gammaproteobacteria bacterium]
MTCTNRLVSRHKGRNVAVTYSTHGNWAEVILDRPERKNAIVGPLGVELAEALEAANAAQDIDAVLLRGRGGAFCSGLDLDEFSADPPPDWMAQWPSTWRRAHRALFECNKPIVGALERYAINGGAALMLGCDFVIVGEQSFLQVGEVQLGMAAPYNLAWLALRHGEAVSAKLALLGDRVYGSDLVSLGVALECVAEAEVVPAAVALTEKLASYPSGAPTRIKKTLRGYVDAPIDDWFDKAFANSAGGAKPPQRR